MKTSILSAILLFVFAAFAPADEGYKVGDKARGFSLKNIDDKIVSLANFKEAKGFIVVFTCNHCPFAVKYEDRIIAANKKYAPLGYPVIAINPNDVNVSPEDSFEKMKERAAEKGFDFPYLYDETQEIARTYGATRTPHVYVLQKEKQDLVVKYIGAIDDNSGSPQDVKEKYLGNAIDNLLAGKKVQTDFTKAIGCTIKWKK